MDQNFTEEFTCKPYRELEGNGILKISEQVFNKDEHNTTFA